MRLRKIPLIVLFAAASAFGSKSAVANSCDFVIPIDEFAAFAHVSYTCVTNPFTGFSVCLRLWQTRTGDTYFATNDDDVPCLLTGFTLAQYPYVIDIRFNFGHPLGSPVLHTQTDTDHPMYPTGCRTTVSGAGARCSAAPAFSPTVPANPTRTSGRSCCRSPIERRQRRSHGNENEE